MQLLPWRYSYNSRYTGNQIVAILTNLSTRITKIIVAKLNSCVKVKFWAFLYDVIYFPLTVLSLIQIKNL